MTRHRTLYRQLSPVRRRWRRLPFWQRFGAVALVLLALGAGAGLAVLPSAAAGSNPGAPPLAVVLVGPGASPATTSAVFDKALDVAQAGQEQFMVGPLTDSTASADAHLTADGINDIERAANLKAKLTAVRDRFTQLQRTPSGNAVDGLHALGQHLLGYQRASTDVALIGDLTHVAPGVDLNDAIERGDPTAVVSKVAGLLPDCTGWRVHVVAGSGTGDGPVVDTRRDLEVREVWRRLIAKCGGLLTGWDTSQLVTFPSTVAVPGVVFGPPCAVQFRLPGDVLFAGDHWNLLPAAQPVLRSLLVSVTVIHPHAQVAVDGYTADTKDTKYDLGDLSRWRAEAVRQWLIDQGVASERITAAGHGPADPVAGNDSEAGQRLNRRVEVQLQLPASECTN